MEKRRQNSQAINNAIFSPFYLLLIICLLITIVEVVNEKRHKFTPPVFQFRTMFDSAKTQETLYSFWRNPKARLGKRYVCSSRIFIVKTPNKVDIKTLGNWPVLPTQGYTVCRPWLQQLYMNYMQLSGSFHLWKCDSKWYHDGKHGDGVYFDFSIFRGDMHNWLYIIEKLE